MVSIDGINVDRLLPCANEESDANMLSMKKTSIIQTIDTDSVVLIDIFADRLGCERLTVAIGTGISFRCVDATGRY